MNTTFKPSFFRDVKKVPATLYADLDSVITKIESAQSLKELPNLKKLKGHKTAYRIKLGNYGLCFYFENGIITIARFLPRKDVYNSFP
jgi:mRNA interferase RelE/StbE